MERIWKIAGIVVAVIIAAFTLARHTVVPVNLFLLIVGGAALFAAGSITTIVLKRDRCPRYTADEFRGLVWKWVWHRSEGPETWLIHEESLKAFCPECSTEVPVVRCQLACPSCSYRVAFDELRRSNSFGPTRREGDDVRHRVKNECEARFRRGDWKLASKRIAAVSRRDAGKDRSSAGEN